MKKPWSFGRAGAYLQQWVANNATGTYGWPPDLGFLVNMMGEPSWTLDMAVEWRDYAPQQPVRITIAPERNKKRK